MTESTTRPFESGCPACGSADHTPVVRLDALPVFCNVLFESKDEATSAPVGDIDLVACDGCTLLYNRLFDPELAGYAPGYENALHHSPTFAEFSERLSTRLAENYSPHGGLVAEVGSGGGRFLEDFCEGVDARGIGFDPSYADETDESAQVHVVRAPFPTDGSVQADLVLARHVFEHLTAPQDVAGAVAGALLGRGSGTFYVEVPDATYMLREIALWDVIYEHCTYFTAASLHRLLSGAGLTVVDIGTEFGGQYLWADAVAGPAEPVAAPSNDPDLADSFATSVSDYVARWNAQLGEMLDAGPVVVWGAGSKGVTFLNLLERGREISAIVDLNPLKHGRFVPGVGTQVVAPSQIVGIAPSAVVVMNPLYREEISADLHDRGVGCDLKVA